MFANVALLVRNVRHQHNIARITITLVKNVYKISIVRINIQISRNVSKEYAFNAQIALIVQSTQTPVSLQ